MSRVLVLQENIVQNRSCLLIKIFVSTEFSGREAGRKWIVPPYSVPRMGICPLEYLDLEILTQILGHLFRCPYLKTSKMLNLGLNYLTFEQQLSEPIPVPVYTHRTNTGTTSVEDTTDVFG